MHCTGWSGLPESSRIRPSGRDAVLASRTLRDAIIRNLQILCANRSEDRPNLEGSEINEIVVKEDVAHARESLSSRFRDAGP